MMAKRKKQQQTDASSAMPGQAAEPEQIAMSEQITTRPELPEHAQDQSPLGEGGPRDRIASRAYEIYLERGGGDGRDMDDWLQAEKQLSDSSRESGE